MAQLHNVAPGEQAEPAGSAAGGAKPHELVEWKRASKPPR